MPKRKKNSRLRQLSKRFQKLAVVGVFVVVGLVALRASLAASQATVTGKITDTRTGKGVGGIKLDGCHGLAAKTDSSGNWSFKATIGVTYCARVSGIPSGWSGPLAINNRSEHAGSKTYEYQTAARNCYHDSTCGLSQTWDLATDSGFNFHVTSPKPKPKPKPSPTPSPAPSIQPTTSPVKAVDKSAPSQPKSFKATKNDANKSIVLSWRASKDNVGVRDYNIDRSEGGGKWTAVVKSTTTTSYEDSTVNFGTTYNYRVRASDNANNHSGYAFANVSTSNFQSNTDPARDNTIVSDDQIFAVVIPAGALDSKAFCIIQPSSSVDLSSLPSNKVIAGPNDLLCRDADGALLTSFTKPLILSVNVGNINTAGTAGPLYYGLSNSVWSQLNQTTPTTSDNVAQFDLGSNTTFVVVGKQQKKSPLGSILITVLVIFGFIAAALLVLRGLQKRKFQKEYDDYVRKSRGG